MGERAKSADVLRGRARDGGRPLLLVCQVELSLFGQHPCHKAGEALREAGIDFERVVEADGRPFSLGTKGTRPVLRELTGKESLPALLLPDGEAVSGSGAIVAWARAQTAS